ncbi:MAG TPA: glycosyltransferase family 39 protein [Polyangiaceae bacterium]|nr:glycosyltransferase family 39 protein [Polyangiaceae bacterium]
MAADLSRTEPGTPASRALRWGTLVFAGCSLGAILSPGLWDPVELERVEWARRIAVGLLGASEYASPGDSPLPSLSELGQGELPFLLMACGLRIFGLHAWAARLPLALCALVGLGGLFFLVDRLENRRAAWLSVLAVACTPAYFLQARTLTGEIVTFAAVTLASAGLGVLGFDVSATLWARIAAWVCVVTGLAVGLATRGALLGIAVPVLGFGLTSLALALAGVRVLDPRFHRSARGFELTALGPLLSLGGVVVALWGARAVSETPPERYSRWVGALTGGSHPIPTFDVTFRDLGHGLLPWSAVLPFALARVLARCKSPRATRFEPDLALRMQLVCTSGVALLLHSALTKEFGVLPFCGTVPLIAIAPLSLLDLEERAERATAWAVATAALLVLLLLDFLHLPEKGLAPLGLSEVEFPAAFVGTAFLRLAPILAFVGVSWFYIVAGRETVDSAEKGAVSWFAPAEYLRWPRVVRRLWLGNLGVTLVTIFGALLAFDLIQSLSERYLGLAAFGSISEISVLLVRAAWLGLLSFLIGPELVLLGRDVTSWVLAQLGAQRATAAVFVFASGGALLGLVYYRPLFEQLRGGEVFAAYARRAAPGEPLGVYGSPRSALRYEAPRAEANLFDDLESAIGWLCADKERRFLSLGLEELAFANSAFRSCTTPRRNLAVLSLSTGRFVLASNRAKPSDTDRNPFASVVLSTAPAPDHPLDVDLGGLVHVMGWELRDASGNVVRALRTGVDYEFLAFYRVMTVPRGNWKAFVHIERLQQRLNADHALLDGKYPTTLWMPGDILVDKHRFRLRRDYPSGVARVYFGLYSGERRLEVRRGEHDADRVSGGTLEVL